MEKELHRQIVLPWTQVVRIALSSLRVRFLRSCITALSLTLAIAFVAYTWSGYDILNALWPHTDVGLQERIMSSGYEMSSGRFGSTPKDLWLAVLSLLVCVVGIVNAQLMSVTERFREIGTFKCLGALDSFIVRIFVLEALYLGLLGGIAGSILGVLVSTMILTVKLGWAVMHWWPPGRMLTSMGLYSLLAVFLSLSGAIYPALVAAKMQPAMALRTEQ